MSLVDRIPFGDRHDVRQRVEELFSREMLGAVLVGKFVGDYAAILTTGAAGTHLGYGLGIIVTIGTFVYWDRMAKRYQRQKNELNPAQTTVGDWSDD